MSVSNGGFKMKTVKRNSLSSISISFFLAFSLLSFLFSCSKPSEQKDSIGTKQLKQSPASHKNLSNYSDSCIQAAKLWLQKNDLADLLDKFEKDQREQSEIDHSINYSTGNFIVAEISSSPLKYSVSYRNTSTNATFVISWIVDFSVRRIYANQNEYGYDKEGVSF